MTFTVGTEVRTRLRTGSGHTRLPGYLQNARGVIVNILGSFPFPDDAAANGGAARKSRLYTVAFPSSTIFGGGDEGTICADMFEEYLEVEA